MSRPKPSLRSLGISLKRAVCTLGLGAAFFSAPAWAFPHVVENGETLASLARRFYGRVQMERILVAANHLDKLGIRTLAPGMRMEIPAVTWHRVAPGETWKSLAQNLLGNEKRANHLASVNQAKLWVEPEVGQILLIPYNLTWLVSGEESVSTLAYRYLGSTKMAWPLTEYNQLDQREPTRGDLLMIPLTELTLTTEGVEAAKRASLSMLREGKLDAIVEQNEATTKLADVLQATTSGRYVTALALAAELRAKRKLERPKQAILERQLLEIYTALDAPGPARNACAAMRQADPNLELDPVMTSPKILKLCPPGPAPAPPANSTP